MKQFNLKVVNQYFWLGTIGIFLSLSFCYYNIYFFTFFIPLIIISTILYSIKIHGNIYSPIVVFSIGWLLPSLSTFIIGYSEPKWLLNELTWLVILIVYISFFVGYFVHYLFFKSKNLELKDNFKDFQIWHYKKFKIGLTVLFVLGFTGLIINLSHVFKQGGFKLYFSGFRNLERIFGSNPIVNYLYFLNGLVVILCTIYLLKYGKDKLVITYSILSFISLFFITIKNTVIFPLTISFIGYCLYKKKIKWRIIILIIIIILLVFMVVTVGRRFTEKDTFSIEETLGFSLKSMIYYVAPNYSNFQQELLKREERTAGILTFGSLIDLVKFVVTGQRAVVRNPQKSWVGGIKWHLVQDGMNMGTFMRGHYIDFGIPALIFFPAFIGFISTWFYADFLIHKNTRSLFFYSIICMILLSSFWTNHFLRIQYLYWIFIVYVIDKIFKIKLIR